MDYRGWIRGAERKQRMTDQKVDDFPPFIEGTNPKVGGITLRVRSASKLKLILKHLEPGYLQKIELIRPDESQHLPPLDLNEIASLEQWEKAKEMNISQFSVKFSIESIAHFSIGKVVFDEVTVDQILDLIKVSFESKTFEYFEVTYINIDDPEKLNDNIGPKRLKYGEGDVFLLVELHLPLIKIWKKTVGDDD